MSNYRVLNHLQEEQDQGEGGSHQTKLVLLSFLRLSGLCSFDGCWRPSNVGFGEPVAELVQTGTSPLLMAVIDVPLEDGGRKRFPSSVLLLSFLLSAPSPSG